MSERRRIPNSLHEDLQQVILPGGLTLMLNPRPQFARTFGVVATQFGSLDHLLPGSAGAESVPDGVAHFLEHKLFEDEQGDVSLRFSARGAACNAATEFTRTSYHFSCADQVEANVRTLLEFVFQPYFTAASVAKEQGIIEQEIRMYEDDPDWRIFFQLLQALYHQHPVRLDIAGSVESIRAITPDILYRCHRVYYHPANMVLAVAGGFDADAVEEVATGVMASLAVDRVAPPERPRFTEPDAVRTPRAELPLSVARPQVCLGFKDRDLPADPQQLLRRELCSRLLLDVVFAMSSPLHQRLYESGIIDDSFDASYAAEHDFGFTAIAGETDDPDAFVTAIHDTLRQARHDGIRREDFARMRNRSLGRFVRLFNSAESVAALLVSCHFRRILPDDILRASNALTIADLEQRLAEHLVPGRSAVSVLRPLAAPAQ